jgi:hypothetical protein
MDVKVSQVYSVVVVPQEQPRPVVNVASNQAARSLIAQTYTYPSGSFASKEDFKLITGSFFEFAAPLPQGTDYYRVTFPIVLEKRPISVLCELENPIDNLIYSHAICGVSNSGFWIGFSDYLTNSGYVLHTRISL